MSIAQFADGRMPCTHHLIIVLLSKHARPMCIMPASAVGVVIRSIGMFRLLRRALKPWERFCCGDSPASLPQRDCDASEDQLEDWCAQWALSAAIHSIMSQPFITTSDLTTLMHVGCLRACRLMPAQQLVRRLLARRGAGQSSVRQVHLMLARSHVAWLICLLQTISNKLEDVPVDTTLY